VIDGSSRTSDSPREAAALGILVAAQLFELGQCPKQARWIHHHSPNSFWLFNVSSSSIIWTVATLERQSPHGTESLSTTARKPSHGGVIDSEKLTRECWNTSVFEAIPCDQTCSQRNNLSSLSQCRSELGRKQTPRRQPPFQLAPQIHHLHLHTGASLRSMILPDRTMGLRRQFKSHQNSRSPAPSLRQ
jgi:hypothetical protein